MSLSDFLLDRLAMVSRRDMFKKLLPARQNKNLVMS
jgi:hypothetical protein